MFIKKYKSTKEISAKFFATNLPDEDNLTGRRFLI